MNRQSGCLLKPLLSRISRKPLWIWHALPWAVPQTSLQVLASASDSFDLTDLLERTEKDLIVQTLSATGGAQAEAARRMGLSRSALAYKLNKYGIRMAGN